MANTGTTIPDTELTAGHRRTHPKQEVPALMIAWHRTDPDRVGQVFLLPSDPCPYALGRGEGPVEGHVRAMPMIQRPGSTERCPPLADPRISRMHFSARTTKAGLLEVINRGRGGISISGRSVDKATLSPGDMVQVGRTALLLYTRRPEVIASSLVGVPTHEFRSADRMGLVGESPRMWTLREQVNAMAIQRAHALVHGPSGTGKELVSQALHALSGVRGPLVSRNAATFPEGLIDAELFGNMRNYPNPGIAERPGLIGEAHGGTLFLDEIGELPEALQAHLLRVLDEGEYQRLGEARRRTARFRFIGATRRPLEFLRHDFLARLPARIQIPGLGELVDDIPLLIDHQLAHILEEQPHLTARFAGENGRIRVSPTLVRFLCSHRYTTHMREMEAILRLSILHSPNDYLTYDPQMSEPTESASTPRRSEPTDPRSITSENISESLSRHDGVRERVWRELGLSSRYALNRLMKKYDIH